MVSPSYLATYVPPVVSLCRVPRVLGRVSLWGDVVEGTRGWRAGRAYPAELWLPQITPAGDEIDGLEAVALDLLDYAVPVHICDGVTARELVAELSGLAARERRTGAAAA